MSSPYGEDLPELNWAEHHRFERDIALFNIGILDMAVLMPMPDIQAAGYLGALETDAGTTLQEAIRVSSLGD
jgi:hypothetical protein